MNRTNLFLTSIIVASISLHAATAQQPFQLAMDANSVWARAGESPVFLYRYNTVHFKPYIKELYSPGGMNVLLDAPSDHLHHHGIMFAMGVDGENFWEETPTAGHQNHMAFDDMRVRAQYASPSIPVAQFKEWVWWNDGFQRRLVEHRRIEACQTMTPGTDAMATVLTWQSELRLPAGKKAVTLGGSHYFGLGMRFPRSMDGTGTFLNADGKEGTIFRGEERLVQSNWCAYQVTADGKPVTIAMFGDPGNKRGPTTWFTMAKPFAYMSATLGLHEEPLEIRSPVILTYAVAIWDRHIPPVQIDASYRKWSFADWKLNDAPTQRANQERLK